MIKNVFLGRLLILNCEGRLGAQVQAELPDVLFENSSECPDILFLNGSKFPEVPNLYNKSYDRLHE